jgi:hypothetical protein
MEIRQLSNSTQAREVQEGQGRVRKSEWVADLIHKLTETPHEQSHMHTTSTDSACNQGSFINFSKMVQSNGAYSGYKIYISQRSLPFP